MTEPLLTVREVAARMHVSVTTVNTLKDRRKIPFVKIGKLVRFDWSQVEDALKRMTVKAIGATN